MGHLYLEKANKHLKILSNQDNRGHGAAWNCFQKHSGKKQKKAPPWWVPRWAGLSKARGAGRQWDVAPAQVPGQWWPLGGCGRVGGGKAEARLGHHGGEGEPCGAARNEMEVGAPPLPPQHYQVDACGSPSPSCSHPTHFCRAETRADKTPWGGRAPGKTCSLLQPKGVPADRSTSSSDTRPQRWGGRPAMCSHGGCSSLLRPSAHGPLL